MNGEAFSNGKTCCQRQQQQQQQQQQSQVSSISDELDENWMDTMKVRWYAVKK